MESFSGLCRNAGDPCLREVGNNMIRQPDPSSNIPTAYKKPSTAIASGYPSLPFDSKRQAAASPFRSNTIHSGYMPGYSAPSKNPDGLSTVYCKTPQSLKAVPANPIDLSSKRALRVTPDSTGVDDHAVYLDQEHKMIPAHTAQTFLTPGNHDRRMVDVQHSYMTHYGMNGVSGVSGNHFGLMQGNGSIPPTSVSFDMFPQQRVSPSPALSYTAAAHPLTSSMLKRTPMYASPSGTYEQYHPTGYPSAPGGYQIQPNLPRASGDPMTSMYQANPAQSMRNAKHISPLDKSIPVMFAETQMRKTPTSVATTIASVTHTAPLQATYIQELQPSSYHSHSAFQKPVFTKDGCPVGMPNPCSCYWPPSEQPVTTYSPAHRMINPVQAVHSLPAVNKSVPSSGIIEAHKPSPNYQLPQERSRINHQIPHHQQHHQHHHIQHDGPHKAHMEHPNHLQNHQENGIVGLQNTVLKLTSAVDQPLLRTSETNGIDHPSQNVYSCASDTAVSKYNVDQMKSAPSCSNKTATTNNNNNIIARPNLPGTPNHLRDKIKPKVVEPGNADVTYCKTVAVKSKPVPEYNSVDARQGTHPLKKVYYQKTQQNPGYYYDILNNRNEKNVINYNKQPNNNNNTIKETSSSSWVISDESKVAPPTHPVLPGAIAQPIDSASRAPNCWRPPVSFSDNGENGKPGLPIEKIDRPNEYTGSGCDKYPYQVNSVPSSPPIKQTLTPNTIDDENRVSSTTDLIQPTSKTSNKQSQTLKLSPKPAVTNRPPTVSPNASIPKQSPSPQSKAAAAAARASQEKYRMLIIEAAEKKKLFDSYNFELLIWARRKRFLPGHHKNLLKDIEESTSIASKYESKFPADWRKDVATYKLSVRVPCSLVTLPEGFELPVKSPEAVEAKNDAGNDSGSNSSKYGDTTANFSGETSKCFQSNSIVTKLENKYRKHLNKNRKSLLLCRPRPARSKSESSDTEDEQDEQDEQDEEDEEKETKQKPAETKCKKPPVKKFVPRTTRRAEEVRKKKTAAETMQSKRSSSNYSPMRSRRRRDSGSGDERPKYSDDDSSADESSSAANDDVWDKVKRAPVAERRKERERESKRTTEKRAPRKRSPLDQLASSDGYVAENKKPKTDNLYSDSSLLGREQRALQRAMMQFTALELSHKKLHHGKKSKVKKKTVRNNVKIFKRQLRNRSVNISTKTDYEADVVKTRTKKQNGIFRKVAVTRYNKNAAYEEELNKEAQRLASKGSGPSLRSKSSPTKTGSHNQESEGEYDEEQERSDDPVEDDDYKPYKPPINTQPSVKQMVTRSAGITMQNQWQTQQKKRLVYLRKRRFRSGLDMINFHKRQKRRREMCLKKYGANHFKERMEAYRVLKQKTEPAPTTTDGPPAELKKLMINKALGETILHRASRLGYSEVVLYCLDTNTNEVNSRDNAGYTPLHECCSRGHVNIASYLLEYGADPNASAAGGIRPIHDAIENNHVEIVRLLLSYGADPTITTYSGASPLKLAKSEQMAEFLKGFFSDINGESTNTPFWRFHGTSSLFDPEGWGCNVFDNLPPADSDCEDDNIVFEVSDKPHLPTFKLHPSNSSTDILQSGNYVLLQDVLIDLKTTQDAFTTKHKHINIITLSKSQFIESVMHSQTFPQDDVTSSVSNIDRVQSKSVQLIPLDNDIRNILGVECITVR